MLFVKVSLMFGTTPGGKTIPEKYSKWPVFGADASC
jgi:hypothetical protein